MDQVQKNEQLFFLPRPGSVIGHEWGQQGNSQFLYAECCRHGMNLLTREILEHRASGSTEPLLEKLYRTAAKVRRDTAMLLKFPLQTWPMYGLPHVGYLFGHVSDEIDRWADKSDFVYAKVRSLAKGMRDGSIAIESHYGSDHAAEASDPDELPENQQRFIIVSRNVAGTKIPVTNILYQTHDGVKHVYFERTSFDNRRPFAEMAERDFQTCLSWDGKEDGVFWDQMAMVSRDIFQQSPLILGSQTAGLMILGAMIKACGFEVIPREPTVDHTMDAGLYTPLEYRQAFLQQFDKIPERIYSQAALQSLEVDSAFFEKKKLRIVDMSGNKSTIEGRVQQLLRAIFYDREGEIRPTVSEVEVTNGRIAKILLKEKEHQHKVDYVLDFIGPENLAQELMLEKLLHERGGTVSPLSADRLPGR